jgi:hypothetical protein
MWKLICVVRFCLYAEEEEHGARSGERRACVANPPQFQANSNVREVPKRPIQRQALETSQADPSG